MVYLYAACGGLILLFVFLILKKNKKVRADYLLIGINLLIGCFMLADVMIISQLSSWNIIFQNLVPLLLFPIFTFYVLQFVQSQQKVQPAWYLLFVPAVALLVYSLTDHYIFKNYETQELVNAHFNTPTLPYHVIFKGSQIGFILVLSWLLTQLKRFEQTLKEGFSSIETIDLKWLQHFTWIYWGSILLTFILFLSQNLGLLPFEIQQVFGIIYGILVVSVFYLNYQGIQHYTLAQVYQTPIPNERNLTSKTIAEEPKKLNSEKKTLSAEERALEQDILETIQTKKLYLEPKFSLNELALILGKNRHIVSKVINSKEGRTFYDLVNGYRVNHLISMMENPEYKHFTILAMGLESGFNSKASLNRIFKNTMGLTPKQYISKKSQSVTN